MGGNKGLTDVHVADEMGQLVASMRLDDDLEIMEVDSVVGCKRGVRVKS